ncbi:sigma-70 family RNA polymerase sigma factor (plasmid) [Nostoc sp. UHCC 0926]|uniref:sigma-70 family RNA polymerase sigma factor n=1 Tax=Nostoc sp. UHCC 0926 TaxID=3025190 RepID=UPI00235FB855|nr:sigma-70 family RNA polymerase sigma factor [Nostoc sp. UHCC 0926]WDD36973.1 sigma-70 family RNA polymerase sigma factor [Nostoc sp. UHCC 0926]
MNEEEVTELAVIAQQQLPGTTGRRIALSKLMDVIYRSPKLWYFPNRNQYLPGVYEDIYEEARQDLFVYISQNLDKYDPTRAQFMTWANMLLKKRFFKDAIPKIIGKNELKVDPYVLENKEYPQPDNTEVDWITAVEKIKQYIETDPEGIFKQERIKGHPQANFRQIAIKKWSGISWKQMSEEWEIPIPTLSNFYQRSLQRFRENFINICNV